MKKLVAVQSYHNVVSSALFSVMKLKNQDPRKEFVDEDITSGLHKGNLRLEEQQEGELSKEKISKVNNIENILSIERSSVENNVNILHNQAINDNKLIRLNTTSSGNKLEKETLGCQ
jgi:hypothetical protein